MSLLVLSINIEGHRHLDRVIPFIQQQLAKNPGPVVVNLQEVYAVDLPILEHQTGLTGHFVPMANVTVTSIHQSHALGEWGLAQLYSPEFSSQQESYYVGGSGHELPVFFANEDPNAMWRAVSWVRGKLAEKSYTIATTHFTWSPQGQATELQKKNLQGLLKIVTELPDLVITGDFNAPRGGEIFAQLATQFKDNIPPEITTTIDGQFHKAGQLEFVVDGFFSSEVYQVTQAQVISGVSDHQALVGLVERV